MIFDDDAPETSEETPEEVAEDATEETVEDATDAEEASDAVSYTHLTLPTTPYV